MTIANLGHSAAINRVAAESYRPAERADMIETRTLRRTVLVPDPDYPGEFLRIGQDIEVEIRYPGGIDSVAGDGPTDWRVVHSQDARHERERRKLREVIGGAVERMEAKR